MPCSDTDGPLRHLEELRHELAGRGWTTSLLEPVGRCPRLFVQNPEPDASFLSDHVLVASGSDGTCWFWWPWASRIAPTHEVTRAADRVIHVLRVSEADRAHAIGRAL
jgi:hypothetical protein